jgi:hypothetical protein
VAGPHDGLLVLSAPIGAQELTQVVPSGPGWATRPLPVETGVRGAVLAGAGGRYAVLAYRVGTPGAGGTQRCRLALLDLEAGAVLRTHNVCGAGESLRDVALDEATGAPIAYVALWRGPTPDTTGYVAGDGSGRVVALAAETGAVLASHTTEEVPERLLPGPAPGGVGRRVYSLEVMERVDLDAARLVALDAATLYPERDYPLPTVPLWPALAPDGEHLYALAGLGGAGARRIMALDLTTGAVSPLLNLPGDGLGLAATAGALYVLDSEHGRLWTFDRHRGRLLNTTPIGRRPIAMTLRQDEA